MTKTDIIERYARKTIKHPHRRYVVHHGDCDIFRCSICTCGLLHDLVALKTPSELYPLFIVDSAAQTVAIHKLTRHNY